MYWILFLFKYRIKKRAKHFWDCNSRSLKAQPDIIRQIRFPPQASPFFYPRSCPKPEAAWNEMGRKKSSDIINIFFFPTFSVTQFCRLSFHNLECAPHFTARCSSRPHPHVVIFYDESRNNFMCAILWITGISKIFCIKYQHKKASLPSVNLLKRHLPASDPIFPFLCCSMLKCST